MECETSLVRATEKVVRPIFFGQGLDNVDEIQQSAQTVRQEFKLLDEQLANRAWLVGESVSAADIGVYPVIQLFLRAASKDAAQPFNLGLLPLAQTYPQLARWAQRIEALPNYQRTYPPHWR
jgi:glutathione S-transferase